MKEDQHSRSTLEQTGLGRRDFLRGAALAVGSAAASVAAVTLARHADPPATPSGPDTVREIPELASVARGEGADILVRMQDELRKALAKPMEERRWALVIDTRKCVGCHACTVACVAENKLPPGVVYRPVITEEKGAYPNLLMRFFPRPCMQCDKPSCTSVCPVNATWKRKDGVVAVDYDKCIGCRYCLSACPYGARTSDFGHTYTGETPVPQLYEERPSHEYGKAWSRQGHGSPKGNARKCHFCLHRLQEGELPMCVTTCIGRANYFGDAGDTASLVAEQLRQHNQIKLLEEKGTHPAVTYLI
ncbi:MAG: 4Fe-4S dicluster domain-containing protein [bacterium]|nr:4Fe-4S dicluster domain-containing protein [bacterium]